MKKLFTSIALLFIFISGFTQIYEPEGLNMPGAWNGWNNPPSNCLGLASSTQVAGGRVTKIAVGTLRWQTILKAAATGGDVVGGTYEWLFTSGSSGNPWGNKWGGVTVTMNSLQAYTKEGSNNSITIIDGKWYTMNWKDNGYSNTDAIFMVTSAAPVSFVSVTQTPLATDVFPGQPVNVNITSSATPSSEEKVYVRYSTDDFATSSVVLANFTGTAGTATIPALTGTVKYYVFSTTKVNPSTDYDMYTIKLINNSGLNYSYTVAGSWLTTADGNWSYTSTWQGGVVPVAQQPVTIAHNVNIDQDVAVSSISINLNKTLTINTLKSLTVSGTLTNNAGNTGLVVKSGGSLIEHNGVSATVERVISGNEWHLISAPVSDAFSEMFTGKYLQKHTESTNLYTDITDIGIPLTPMKGFALWGDATGFTASFAGLLNTGSKSMAVTRSAAGTGRGWNLVGNPYPSSINWDASSGWIKTNVANATYIHVSSSTWAQYVNGAGTNGGSQYIAPGQGFFVYVKDDGSTSGTLAVDNTVRVNNSTPFYKNTANNLVRLQVSGNEYTDEAVVRFLPEATAEFDYEFDALKLYGDVAEAAQIYTNDGSQPLAINTLPETSSVPVGIHVGTSGTYTITATELTDLPVAALEDIQTGIITDLLSNSYTFNFTTGEDEQRFVLHFGTVSVPETFNSTANIYSNGKIAYVDLMNSSKGEISIYTITGQLVTTASAVQGINKFNLAISGNYIVKFIGNQNTIVKKVWIQ